MKSIDERVVQMGFDNQQFEKGVGTTLRSLENLKKGLNFDGGIRSFADLDRASKSVSLSTIADGVEAIANKFTALGIMGVTVLANLTNSAVNFSKNLVSALTVDPIKTGLNEYETKMGSIQTILTNTASKGTTLQDVTRVLDELNTYSDQTIYNFAEMARNIGTFTAAGNGLEESATAIKGIANLAAGSGSNAQQASTAMYQLSQALSTGTVRLMDWNSVVNAGMGGELFQKALEKTAIELGRGRDMSVSFRDSLEQGWLTSEVLMKTLAKFAEDEALVKAATQVKTFTQLFDTMKESVQSGWAQSWEAIIGDKDEATAMLTAINNAFGSVVGASAEARNATLDFWNANGGRDALIQAFTNAFKGLSSVIKPISEAFREVFPAMTGQRLVEITKGLEALTEKFKMDDGTAEKIKTTFKGLFSVVDTFGHILMTFVKGASMIAESLFPITGGILYITESIGKFLININKSIESSNILGRALDGLGSALTPISIIFDNLKKSMPGIYGFANAISDVFGNLGQYIASGLGNFNGEKFFALLNGGLLAALLIWAKNLMSSFSKVVASGGGALKGITGILKGVKECLSAYQMELNASTLFKIAAAIGLLAVSLVALSLIKPEKLDSAISAMTMMFGELVGSLILFEKFAGGFKIRSMAAITPVLIGLSIAILTLSAALAIMASLDWDGIARGVVGIGALMAELTLFLKFSSAGGLSAKSGMGIMFLATALVILAEAVRKFSEMDTDSLIKGLIGVAAVLTEIGIFVNFTGGAKGVISTSIGLTILASAMLIFAKAIGNMGGMSIETLAKGLGALAVSLTIIAVAMKFMSSAISGAAALLIVASALSVFTLVLKSIGSMSLEQIGKGLLTLVGLFVILGATSAILSPLIPALLGLGGAIALIGVGCLAVGAGLIAFSAGLAALAISGTAGAAALVVIVTSIIGLIPMAMKAFAEGISSSASAIAEALVALLEAFAKYVPRMVQAGLELILGVLRGINDNIQQITEVGISIVVEFIEGVASQLPSLIQAGFDLIISFINGLSSAIDANAEILAESFVDLGTSMIDGLVRGLAAGVGRTVESIWSLGADIINGFKDALGIHSPSTVFEAAGGQIIDGLTNGIMAGKPKAVAASTNVADETLKAVRDTSALISVENGKYMVDGIVIGMVSKQPDMYEASKLLALAIQNGLIEEEPRFRNIGDTEATTFLTGLSDQAIIDKAWASGVKVSSSAWEGAKTTAEKMTAAGTAAGQAYIDGLNKAALDAKKKADEIYDRAAQGFYAEGKHHGSIKDDLGFEQLEQLTDKEADEYWKNGGGKAGAAAVEAMKNVGKDASSGLTEGLKSGTDGVKKAAETITKTLIDTTKHGLGINSPSKVFMEFGQYSVLGFIKGLGSLSSRLADAIAGNFDAAPVIRPVLNLDDIQNGITSMNKLLATDNDLAVAIADRKIPRGENPENVDNPGSKEGILYSFTQNNYSPKPLSRIDIYRQTKNQFSVLKGMVNG